MITQKPHLSITFQLIKLAQNEKKKKILQTSSNHNHQFQQIWAKTCNRHSEKNFEKVPPSTNSNNQSWKQTDFGKIRESKLIKKIALANTAFTHYNISHVPDFHNQVDKFPHIDRSSDELDPNTIAALVRWLTHARIISKHLSSLIDTANRKTKQLQIHMFDQNHNELRISQPKKFLAKREKFINQIENRNNYAEKNTFIKLPTIDFLQQNLIRNQQNNKNYCRNHKLLGIHTKRKKNGQKTTKKNNHGTNVNR